MERARIDTSLIDKIIVGRQEPHIYAFSTETVPNYLKVGDTMRGVKVRLDEWRKIFPNLKPKYEHSAQIDEDTIFRDFAVHYFLEIERKRQRLQSDTFKDLPYYSREFFENATTKDVEDAIKDIIRSKAEQDGKYQFYNTSRLLQTHTYARSENYEPRDNQQAAIDNFKAAVEKGRTNLLLYAVMRFGKSFTAMCCATEIGAKVVVIVSAKADVKEEWKRTVESHIRFEQYKFIDSEALKANENIVSSTLTEGKKVALFLTLQDLQGEQIKEKHKEIFQNPIDLLIVDETHFGARGASYGQVLREQKIKESVIKKELKSVDGFETIDDVEDAVKVLNSKVRLHLSGTPYRILMSDEFEEDDIVAFVQFSDIIDAKNQWDEENLKNDDVNEWDNPYFGFPQMIRFAFNPNESARKKMEELRKEGISSSLSELLKPVSLSKKNDNSHQQFLHHQEVLELLEVIDGSKEDEEVLGFLDYDKLKEGKMCRHIVCVLPYRASCDAMAQLIKDNRDKFKNLGDYEIINIAGFDQEKEYPTTDSVKNKIKNCEAEDRKTLTLTVNRMLTGTTVPQWDTMLYLKGTASPQEYDQAIFRLQNQYIVSYQKEDGETIKYNMKPQTLLVDFDPNRMFRLQELKSQFYNANTDAQGNSQLKERIKRELEISPIIVMNKGKLQEATPTNITDAVREYSFNRSIRDEAEDIPSDMNLFGEAAILEVLKGIKPIDNKGGLEIKPVVGDGDDLDEPDADKPGMDEKQNSEGGNEENQDKTEESEESLGKRLAAYYARILFYAFLTYSKVKSLEDIIKSLAENADNKRIARNLGLQLDILTLIIQKSNPFILRKLDYRIENTNDLVDEAQLSPIKRVEVALRKFGRLSESEIVTPPNVADEMVANLPVDELRQNPNTKFLDIASKQGEFAVALFKQFGENAKNRIYSIPTSRLTYEFTRKAYALLGMPIENIYSDFNSYDLIKENNQEIIQQLKDMQFDVVIGNPPYQEGQSNDSNSVNRAMAGAIYPLFIEMATKLGPYYVCMITPSRWMSKTGRGISAEWVDKILKGNHFIFIHDFPDATECFNNVEIKGGINYFLYSQNYEGPCQFISVKNKQRKGHSYFLNGTGVGFIVRDANALEILDKVKVDRTNSFMNIVASNTLFCDCAKGILNTNWRGYSLEQSSEYSIKYYLNKKTVSSGFAWIKPSDMIKSFDVVPLNKVYIPEAAGSGNDGQVLGTPFYGEPNSICSQTYICIGYDSKNPFTKEECLSIIKYLKTRFLRYLVSIKKNTQHSFATVYQLVPLQDFTENSDIDWSKSVEEIDQQLYKKYGLDDSEIDFIESMIKPMK